MIKKTTQAIFQDGDYRGEYDWQGGIPMSEGETVTVTTQDKKVSEYRLVYKQTTLEDKGEDQVVVTRYIFSLD